MPMLPAIIESIIFAADSPLSLDRLSEILPEFGHDEIKAAIAELCVFHEARPGVWCSSKWLEAGSSGHVPAFSSMLSVRQR